MAFGTDLMVVSKTEWVRKRGITIKVRIFECLRGFLRYWRTEETLWTCLSVLYALEVMHIVLAVLG